MGDREQEIKEDREIEGLSPEYREAMEEALSSSRLEAAAATLDIESGCRCLLDDAGSVLVAVKGLGADLDQMLVDAYAEGYRAGRDFETPGEKPNGATLPEEEAEPFVCENCGCVSGLVGTPTTGFHCEDLRRCQYRQLSQARQEIQVLKAKMEARDDG